MEKKLYIICPVGDLMPATSRKFKIIVNMMIYIASSIASYF